MKYLDVKKLLLLIISLHPLAAAITGNCSFNNNIRPHVEQIGLPFGSIKTTWSSVNSPGSLLLYHVHYNRTSFYNHCEYPTSDALFTAKHCSQDSTIEGIQHECDLTEDVDMLNMNFINENLCVMISMTSPSSNETCYSLFNEYNPYIAGSICPAPDKLQVLSPEAGKLKFIWDVSPKFIGKKTLNEVSFVINYEPMRLSAKACSSKGTKTLSSQNYDFKNNTHTINGMGTCCPYKVTMCCTFLMASTCDPDHISDPIYVTTAEQEPTKAPQIEYYGIQQGSLLVKWKLPSNTLCTDKITAYEIHYWTDLHYNCSLSIFNSTVLKYILNRTSDRLANITGISSVAYCFHIRMWTRAGFGPWSMLYSVQDVAQPNVKNISSNKTRMSKAIVVVTVLAGLGILVLIIIILLIFMIRRWNTRSTRQRLGDTVGDLEPTGDLLDSSQSTELGSVNEDDYASA